MIRHPTVFILGAGASVEYGFPLGAGLTAQIVDALNLTGVLRLPLVSTGLSSDDIDNFATHLTGADLTSIDAFLENNNEQFVQIGKLCIAAMILFREQDPRQNLFAKPPVDHWLKYLWNLMRAETDALSFAENQVSFVTIYYDRLVEYYFDTVLASAFNLTQRDAKNLRERTFQIIHLHGEYNWKGIWRIHSSLGRHYRFAILLQAYV